MCFIGVQNEVVEVVQSLACLSPRDLLPMHVPETPLYNIADQVQMLSPNRSGQPIPLIDRMHRSETEQDAGPESDPCIMLADNFLNDIGVWERYLPLQPRSMGSIPLAPHSSEYQFQDCSLCTKRPPRSRSDIPQPHLLPCLGDWC